MEVTCGPSPERIQDRNDPTCASGAGYCEQRERTRHRASSHVRSLERLGYKVTIEPLAPDADPETGELITRTAS